MRELILSSSTIVSPLSIAMSHVTCLVSWFFSRLHSYAKSPIDHVIGPHGLLANQARILVTNSIAFVKQFDQVVFISRGIIRECGSYQTLMENSDGDLSKLVYAFPLFGPFLN